MTLIEKARSVPFTRWDEINALIEQAQDEATVDELTVIRNMKYHQEEALANCL